MTWGLFHLECLRSATTVKKSWSLTPLSNSCYSQPGLITSNQARLAYKMGYWDFIRHSLCISISETLIIGSTQKRIVEFLQSWLKRSGRSLCSLWLKDSLNKILINWKLGTFSTIGLTYGPNSNYLQWELPRREEESPLSLAVPATTTSINIVTCYIIRPKAISESQLSYKEHLSLVYIRNIRSPIHHVKFWYSYYNSTLHFFLSLAASYNQCKDL